jgi:hypothetical protein
LVPGSIRSGIETVVSFTSVCPGAELPTPILDAAHIRPYGQGGEHDVTNGLLLRTDIHRLFDLGYVTVSNDGKFQVGHRLREDFENGRNYYAMHGQPIFWPEVPEQQPKREFLEWHQANSFLGWWIVTITGRFHDQPSVMPPQTYNFIGASSVPRNHPRQVDANNPITMIMEKFRYMLECFFSHNHFFNLIPFVALLDQNKNMAQIILK